MVQGEPRHSAGCPTVAARLNARAACCMFGGRGPRHWRLLFKLPARGRGASPSFAVGSRLRSASAATSSLRAPRPAAPPAGAARGLHKPRRARRGHGRHRAAARQRGLRDRAAFARRVAAARRQAGGVQRLRCACSRHLLPRTGAGRAARAPRGRAGSAAAIAGRRSARGCLAAAAAGSAGLRPLQVIKLADLPLLTNLPPRPAVVRRFNPALLGTKAREQRALLAMRSALDPGGRVLGSWRNGSDPCYTWWQGVNCDERRERVTSM